MSMKEFLFFGFTSKEDTRSMALLFLRFFIGCLMLTHGWPKLVNYSEISASGNFPDPIGLGSTLSLTLVVLAEVGASLMIMLGVFTRLAAVPLVINMLVAVFVAHGADPFSAKELAVMYLGIYVVLFFLGSGRYSVDYLLFSHKPESSWEECINIGDMDRIVRVVVSIVLGVLYFSGIFTGVWAIVALILAAALLVTGVVGYCAPYSWMGFSTRKKENS